MNGSLDTEQAAALIVAAVLVFWMVGAYNRLMALRNGIGQAWQKVDEALRVRAAAAATLSALLREPLSAEAGALDTWDAALGTVAVASAALASQPVSVERARAWSAGEATLAAAANRVLALIEHQSELRQRPDVAVLAAAWREASSRLAFARQFFNEAAEPYNDAVRQFPTRLLVRVFRFGPAGRL